ncbi:hypothetical protein QBC39DRAFT_88252 [Podospora conica]|nr:hypothetical protein QBC39DRAFT_88252 [Schizothecium conicum]
MDPLRCTANADGRNTAIASRQIASARHVIPTTMTFRWLSPRASSSRHGPLKHFANPPASPVLTNLKHPPNLAEGPRCSRYRQGWDAHQRLELPVLPTTRSDGSNTAYSAPYITVRYRLPYGRRLAPGSSSHPLLILTHNDGWQPQAPVPPPPMRCLAQTSRASQPAKLGATQLELTPLPLSRRRLSHLPHLSAARPPSCCPLPSPPLLSAPSVKEKRYVPSPAELPSFAAFARPPPPEFLPPSQPFPFPPLLFPPSLHRSIHCHPKNSALLCCPSPTFCQLISHQPPIPDLIVTMTGRKRKQEEEELVSLPSGSDEEEEYVEDEEDEEDDVGSEEEEEDDEEDGPADEEKENGVAAHADEAPPKKKVKTVPSNDVAPQKNGTATNGATAAEDDEEEFDEDAPEDEDDDGEGDENEDDEEEDEEEDAAAALPTKGAKVVPVPAAAEDEDEGVAAGGDDED